MISPAAITGRENRRRKSRGFTGCRLVDQLTVSALVRLLLPRTLVCSMPAKYDRRETLASWKGSNYKLNRRPGTDMLTLSVSKKGVALIVRALGGYIAAKGTVQAYAASKNETDMIVRKQNSSRGLWCI
jgi:hypothetical protein